MKIWFYALGIWMSGFVTALQLSAITYNVPSHYDADWVRVFLAVVFGVFCGWLASWDVK